MAHRVAYDRSAVGRANRSANNAVAFEHPHGRTNLGPIQLTNCRTNYFCAVGRAHRCPVFVGANDFADHWADLLGTYLPQP